MHQYRTTISGFDREIEFFIQADGKLVIGSGAGVYNVTATDIAARNGVIHVVDGVFV